MSLIYGDNFRGKQLTSSDDYIFKRLFYVCTAMTSAENLVLPNNTRPHCYEEMFFTTGSGSHRLHRAPKLPATVMTDSCYKSMFEGCDLTGKPELPAMTLAPHCYERMYAFSNLSNPPELPATTLANYCYSNMFYGCPFTKAPDLPAPTLVPYCYQYMFQNCSSLTQIKCMATDRSATDCTKFWNDNGARSGTFIKPSSTT